VSIAGPNTREFYEQTAGGGVFEPFDFRKQGRSVERLPACEVFEQTSIPEH
jgi:hypothetical protein